ncbi:ABC transporter ATP-binding protein [Evansella cellulosilytica]|nr:ABC transporter ATP-binding protein [Evansella cellulosilytica]
MSKHILHLQNLKVVYNQNENFVPVIKDFSIELKKGEVVALLGESGAGKSTIGKALTGLLPPSAQVGSGTLNLYPGLSFQLSSKKEDWKFIRGRKIAMLFQDAQLALNPVLKIKDNFKELLLYHGLVPEQDIFTFSSKLLSKLHFSDPVRVLESYPFQISGGMCQRVCLALALCLEPHLLIADEPTSALDDDCQKEVLDVIKQMNQELGLTVLLITHDIEVAHALADRVVVLHKGAIEEEGPARTVLSTPKSSYTNRLLSSRFVKSRHKSTKLEPSTEPILDIIKLEKSYSKSQPVIKDVNLSVYRKEIVGITGPSGCGKSTLAKCITGLETPHGGNILYRGKEITGLKGKQKREICKHIQLVFQDARACLHPARTALQLVQEPLHYLNIGLKRECSIKAKIYLEHVGIRDDTQLRRPPQLSTGQCQRIALARALVLEPEILICDEAVSALDTHIQVQILELLHHLHYQLDISIIMISHNKKILESFCDRVAIMNNGAIKEYMNSNYSIK